MVKSFANPSSKKDIPKPEAQAEVLKLIAAGKTVEEASRAVGRSPETYKDWLKEPVFRAKVAEMRHVRRARGPHDDRPVIPPFDVFAREYLNQPLYPHQLRMWDVIEGREPRDIHPSMRYEPGTEWESAREDVPAGRVIINIPPGHAKTTTFSINYCVYLIHRDPDVKIIVVCKDQGLAIQILGAVKHRLTSPIYAKMHLMFAPNGGWKDPDASWTQTQIYVNGKGDGEKDPTMQALGIGGRIYGARSDVILLDDAVTLANVNEHVKQQKWLDQEVESRLDGAGLLALLGTRVAPVDLYKQQREVVDFDDEPVYTYFSMPAVLDEGDGEAVNWVPLWPERFSAKKLRKIRRDETTWALVYQQQDVSADATFNAKAVAASINTQRFPGPMTQAGMGHRPGGMSGLYVIGGLDPATVNYTSIIISGLDKEAKKRWILDGVNKRQMKPKEMRDHVKRLTLLYKVNEWVIERNAFQRFLTQDDELLTFLRSHGCKLTEHYTTENKFDADFGVSAMAQLFMTCGVPPSNGGDGSWRKTPDTALIELPNPKQNAWVGELVNQLVVWEPSGMKQNTKTDLVMALWFTEIGAHRILNRSKTRPTHVPNPFLSQGRRKQRQVISLMDYRAMQQAQREAQ